MVEDPRFRTNRDRVDNYDELEKAIGERLGRETLAHWLETFAANGVPAGEVKPLNRVYEWEQVLSQGLVVETEHPTLGTIRLPGPPLRFDDGGRTEHTAPPTLGQHTEQVLAWLDGLDGKAR